MSRNAMSKPVGEIMASQAPNLASQLGTDPNALGEAARQAAEGKILAGENAFVLYADVVGFKEQLLADPEDVERRIETAVTRLNFELMSRVPSYYVAPRHPAFDHSGWAGLTRLNPMTVFSDSMFAVTHDDSPESKRQIAHFANNMFLRFLREGLPIRGAIASGAVWWNRNTDVRLGPAITRAVSFADSLDCIGIVLDDTLPPPENASPSIEVALKNSSPSIMCHVPLQLVRAGLAGCLDGDAMQLFEKLAQEAAKTGRLDLRQRYLNSKFVVEALTGGPILA